MIDKEYNLIPFVPVVSITHIATAFSAKRIWDKDTREIHDFWEFNLDKQVDENGNVQYVLYTIAPNTPHGSDGADKKAVQLQKRLTIISFKCISEVMQFLADKKLYLSSAGVREFKEIVRIAERYITYENNSNNLRPEVEQFQLQVVKNRLELFVIELLKNHGFINEYQGKSRADEKLAGAVVLFMEEHIGEVLSIKDIANHFFVSESLIKTAFRRKYNSGVIDFFNEMKIKAAKNMLSEQDMSVSEVAELLGFHSAGYFSRMFKAKTGVSPVQYVKNLK